MPGIVFRARNERADAMVMANGLVFGAYILFLEDIFYSL